MAAADLDALRAECARRLESELDRIVGELRAMGARLIVLFGSYAAGRRDLFTDLDLLVVMESELPFVRRIPALLERLHPKVATDCWCTLRRNSRRCASGRLSATPSRPGRYSMRPSDQAERWLTQAEDDLRWAAHLRDSGAFNLACVLSQQVAEKAMKALLYHAGREMVVGHSVQDPCQKAAVVWPELAPRCPRWSALDGYYLPTRYPDALPGGLPAKAYDRRAAEEAVATASEAVDAARSIIRG